MTKLKLKKALLTTLLITTSLSVNAERSSAWLEQEVLDYIDDCIKRR